WLELWVLGHERIEPLARLSIGPVEIAPIASQEQVEQRWLGKRVELRDQRGPAIRLRIRRHDPCGGRLRQLLDARKIASDVLLGELGCEEESFEERLRVGHPRP